MRPNVLRVRSLAAGPLVQSLLRVMSGAKAPSAPPLSLEDVWQQLDALTAAQRETIRQRLNASASTARDSDARLPVVHAQPVERRPLESPPHAHTLAAPSPPEYSAAMEMASAQTPLEPPSCIRRFLAFTFDESLLQVSLASLLACFAAVELSSSTTRWSSVPFRLLVRKRER